MCPCTQSFCSKFQVASIYDTNVECQIWCFCYNLFLSYTDNRHTHTDQRLKMWFSDSEGLVTCKSIKIFLSKIRAKNNAFSTITWVRESNKLTKKQIWEHENVQLISNIDAWIFLHFKPLYILFNKNFCHEYLLIVRTLDNVLSIFCFWTDDLVRNSRDVK